MAKKASKSAKKATSKKSATSNKKKTTTMWSKATAKAETVSKITSSIRPKNSNTLSYTYGEFLENIKGFCGLTKRSQAKEICEDIAMFVKDSLKRGYKVPLFGLGKMYVRQTKARMGRNPATGETIHIAPKKRVRFAAAKALKEAVL